MNGTALTSAQVVDKRYQRPCDGNCDLLDAATDRCRARFSLKNGQRLHAIVRVRDGRPCAIRFVKP